MLLEVQLVNSYDHSNKDKLESNVQYIPINSLHEQIFHRLNNLFKKYSDLEYFLDLFL